MDAATPPAEHSAAHPLPAEEVAARLREDHARITTTAGRLSALAQQASAPPIEAVAMLRWRLARQLLVHLPIEDRYLYRALEEDRRPAVAQRAAAFRRDLDALYDAFEAHTRRWTSGAVIADWRGYRLAFPPLRDRLLDRIAREEAELYPLAEWHPPRHARPRRDWTRGAHFLRAAIGDGLPGNALPDDRGA